MLYAAANLKWAIFWVRRGVEVEVSMLLRLKCPILNPQRRKVLMLKTLQAVAGWVHVAA